MPPLGAATSPKNAVIPGISWNQFGNPGLTSHQWAPWPGFWRHISPVNHEYSLTESTMRLPINHQPQGPVTRRIQVLPMVPPRMLCIALAIVLVATVISVRHFAKLPLT